MLPRELEFFTEIPAQADFWESEAPFRAYTGGLGAGKTYAGAVALFMLPPGTRSMVVAPTYRILEDATIATVRELAQACGIEASWNEQKKRLRLTDGSLVLFRSGEKPDRLRGPNLGAFWLDEGAYLKDAVFKVMLGRLRLGPGRAWVTTTPNGKNWVWETFVKAANPRYRLFKSPTYLNPYNGEHYVEDMRASYSAHWQNQEIEGEFLDDNTSSVIPDEWWEMAARAWRPDYPSAGHPRIAIDIAKGSGGNRAVVLVRDDNAIRDLGESRFWDKTRTAQEAAARARKFRIPGHRISFDVAGIGEDFRDYLEAEGINGAVGYRGGRTGHGRAYNLRSFAACLVMAPRFDPARPDLSRPADREGRRPLQVPFAIPPAIADAMRDEVLSLRYTLTAGGARKLETKEEHAARVKTSPDLADALIQSFAFAA